MIVNVIPKDLIQSGSFQGEIAFWDIVSKKWIPSGSELNWDNNTKIMRVDGNILVDSIDGPNSLLLSSSNFVSTRSANDQTLYRMTNPNTGTAAFASIGAGFAESGSNHVEMYCMGANCSYGAPFTAKTGIINAGSNLTGGLNFVVQNATASMGFWTNSSQRLIIDKDGNVGIGTDSPNAPLHVLSTNEQLKLSYDETQVGSIFTDSSGSMIVDPHSDSFKWRMSSGDFELTQYFFYTPSSYAFRAKSGYLAFSTDAVGQSITFKTGGYANTRMTIDGNGNIGIGVITPSEKLDIAGNFWLTRDSDKVLLGAGKDMSFVYDGTNGIIKTNEVIASDLKVITGPEKTLELDTAVWRDELNELIGKRLESPSSHIITNLAEGSLTFFSNCTLADYVVMNIQINHDWKPGTDVKPHLHWWQTSSNLPNWLIQYRWQINGAAKTTSWTSTARSSEAFSYSSGTLNQITAFPSISPPIGYGLSDIIQIRILRDSTNASAEFAGLDPFSGSADGVNFDIHIQANTVGSRGEYIK